MKKKLLYIVLSFAVMGGLTACGKLDVIGDYSVKSFDSVLSAMGDKVTEDTNFGGWSLTAPDKEATLFWSSDYSKTTPYDLKLELDAKPFIDAGLDTGKLPEGMLQGDKIVVGTELGNDVLTYDNGVTPLASYKQIVDHYRYNIKYHSALDHFGISLGNGNMFEWAKNLASNDKDIVFALNPKVFIDAGMDPTKVEGWTFATIPTMDDNGRKIQADKLLKPFDLIKKQ